MSEEISAVRGLGQLGNVVKDERTRIVPIKQPPLEELLNDAKRALLDELLAEMPPNKHYKGCHLIKLGTLCNCQHKSLNYLNNHIRAIIEKKRKEL